MFDPNWCMLALMWGPLSLPGHWQPWPLTSHGTLPLLGAHCNAFWAPLVNFPGENHSLYEKAVAYPFFHINKEFISVCSISFL